MVLKQMTKTVFSSHEISCSSCFFSPIYTPMHSIDLYNLHMVCSAFSQVLEVKLSTRCLLAVGTLTPSSLVWYYFDRDFGAPEPTLFATGRFKWRGSIQLSSYVFVPEAVASAGRGTDAADGTRAAVAGRRFCWGRSGWIQVWKMK